MALEYVKIEKNGWGAFEFMEQKFTISEIKEKKNLIDSLCHISRCPIHIFQESQMVYSSADIAGNDKYKSESFYT